MIRFGAIGVVLVLIGTPPLAAQQSSPRPLALGPVADEGDRFAVWSPPVRTASPAALPATLSPAASSEVVPGARLAPPHGNHSRTGLIVGGIIGGVAAGALSYTLCSNSDGDDDCAATTVKGTLVGGGLGALIGLLVGGTIPKGPPVSAEANATAQP